MTKDFWNLHEIAEAAYRELPRNEWDFVMGGTETETSLRRNRQAIDAWALRPRVLRDVNGIDWSQEFLGRRLRLPVIMAPIGKQTYQGGAATVARAAAEFGCAFALSSVNAMTTIEEVAEAAPDGCNIYQLYIRGDDAWVAAQVDRAVATGCAAVCVTVDTVMISRRERDFANRYTSRGRRHFPGEEYQRGFDWAAFARLRERCPLPLIIKGIATAEDAELAVAAGADAIYVSNHGGRQLDHGIGSLDALAEIADAAAGRAALMVDGGFSRGTDILKGIASGAAIVGIGRLQCLALAADGAAGLARMFELLEDEVEIALGLCGARALAELDRSFLRSVSPVGSESHSSRAFPLLSLPEHSYR